jgi:DNA processing protein
MNIFLKNKLAELLRQENTGRKILLKEINTKYRKDDKYIRYLKEKFGIEVTAFDEKEYPAQLKQIDDFPVLLFTKGDKNLLTMNILTIVGTRQMTIYGSKVIQKLLSECKDTCIASGLASGADGKVHTTCLENNIPTIAVTAGGFFKGFPRSNLSLFNNICRKGLVISEFPPGRKIIKGMFPMRNRILAGMSSAVFVIESDIKGGSMITADLALEYGREVFAVPGSIFSKQSAGCNYLISQGAQIITDTVINDCIHI